MFLTCFFIRKRKKIVFFFILNKIFTNLSQVYFLSILIIHFWSSFLCFIYVEWTHALPYIHHAPWPRELSFVQKGFSFGGTYVLLMFLWSIWLFGKLFGIYISLSKLSYQHYCFTSKTHKLVHLRWKKFFL